MTTTPTVWKALAQANTTDASESGNSQANSRVVALSDGGFLIVWEDDTRTVGAGLEPPDVVGQRFDALGRRVGGEFLASIVYEDYEQQNADLIALPGGGFAVAYQTTGDPVVGDGQNIDVDVFDAPADFQRNDDLRQGGPGPDELFPSITALSATSYVVVYKQTDTSDLILGRVVTDGVLGAEFTVGATTNESQGADTALLSDGNFVVAFESDNPGGLTTDIRVSIRNASGAAATEVLVAGATFDQAHTPVVASLVGGGFVVAWTDGSAGGAGVAGVRAKVFDNAGGFVADVSHPIAGSEGEPALTRLADGGFVLAWNADADQAVHAQRYNAAGATVGTEFSASSSGDASDAQFALLGDGRIVVSFTSTDNTGDNDVLYMIWDPRTGPIQGTADADVLTSRIEGATVYGQGGNDTLLGQGGADVLVGGLGADRLDGGAGSDAASYADAAGGVTASLANANINTGEAAGDTYTSIERLIGSSHNDVLSASSNGVNNTLRGGGGKDTLKGFTGNDFLDGGTGNDTLKGFTGNDTLEGGTGNDTFLFNTALNASTNVDTIRDFRNVANDNDLFLLDNAVFVGISGNVQTRELLSGFFKNTALGAIDTNDHIIYVQSSGNLYYDGNGSAAGERVLFAKLTPGTALTYHDFFVN